MTIELTQVDGVGPSYADELVAAGYDFVEEIAEADPEDLDDVIETMSGETLVENATEALPDDEEAESEDSALGPFELDPDFTEAQQYHLLAALVEQEVSARQRTDQDRLKEVQGMISQVMAGPPYEFTLDQLSIGYTATNQMESDYRGKRGLSTFVSTVRDINQTFQEARQAHWPEDR